MDVKWLLAAAGVTCACTVPDPSYVPPPDDAEVGTTATEGGGDGMAGDSSSGDAMSSGESSTSDEGETTSESGGVDTEGDDGESTDSSRSTDDDTAGGDGDGGTPLEHTTRDCADAEAGVTMTEVQAILDLHCVDCHSPPSTPLGLDLSPGESWANLVNQTVGNCNKIRVIPNEPVASYLLDKLEDIDLCSGQPMPKNRVPLTIQERNVIQSWICAGAPEG